MPGSLLRRAARCRRGSRAAGARRARRRPATAAAALPAAWPAWGRPWARGRCSRVADSSSPGAPPGRVHAATAPLGPRQLLPATPWKRPAHACRRAGLRRAPPCAATGSLPPRRQRRLRFKALPARQPALLPCSPSRHSTDSRCTPPLRCRCRVGAIEGLQLGGILGWVGAGLPALLPRVLGCLARCLLRAAGNPWRRCSQLCTAQARLAG